MGVSFYHSEQRCAGSLASCQPHLLDRGLDVNLGVEERLGCASLAEHDHRRRCTNVSGGTLGNEERNDK